MGVIITGIGTKRLDTNGAVTTGTLSYIETYRDAVRKTAEHALRRKRPHIFMPPTPYYAYTIHKIRGRLYYGGDAANIGWNHTQYDGYPMISNATAAVFDKLTNMAVTACLNDLKGMKLNLAQAFAERRQTANLVASSATKIARSLRSIRKGDFRQAAANLGLAPSKKRVAYWNGKQKRGRQPDQGDLRDMWLELQYGWKPLTGEIYGAMVVLHENDKAEPQRYRMTVKKKRETNIDTPVTTGAGIHYKGFKRQFYSSYVRLDYCMNNPMAAAANDFGIDNPALLAWELLPYSFVVDWFLPIGKYLDGINAEAGYTFMGGSLSKRYLASFNGSVERVGWNFPARKIPYWGGYGCYASLKEVTRTIYSSSPVSRFPGFKNPLSLTHVANAIALLRGSVR